MALRVPLPESHNSTTERFKRQSLECGYKTFPDDRSVWVAVIGGLKWFMRMFT
jgi:hypothetical protein